MATKYDYYESGISGGKFYNTRPSICVNFEASDSYNIEYVVIYGNRNGTFTSLTAYLYTVDGDNKPNELVATGQTINWVNLPTSASQVTFTFGTSPAVTSGTQYAIVFTIVGSSGSGDNFDWYIQNAGGYRRGIYFPGDDWYMYSGQSHWFQVWGNLSPTLPGKPTTPSPTDSASDVGLNDTTATWESGGDTDTYNVFYGTLSGFLTQIATGLTDPSQLLVDGAFGVYNKITYWRVDAVNTEGTTQGDEWYFTTLAFLPVLPSGISLDGDGNPIGTPDGLNNIMTIHKLVAAADNTIWYENI